MSHDPVARQVARGINFDGPNIPIRTVSTAHKLQFSVGDDTEQNYHPNFVDAAERQAYTAAFLQERWAWDASHGAARRERSRGNGHTPVLSGDRLPTVLLNPNSPRAAELLAVTGGINVCGLRRSVINRDDLNA